jgi:predicted Zn-dependent peptidase
MIDRTKPPFNDEPNIFAFPTINSYESNDVTVASYRDATQPLIHLKVVFGRGSSVERIPGSTQIAMQLLLSSIKGMSENDVADKFEFFGASLNALAYWNDAALTFSSPSDHYLKCLDLLLRCVTDLDLKQNELDSIKKRLAANIDYNLSDSGFVCQLAYNKYLLNGTVYARPRSGNKSEIMSVTLEDCMSILLDNILPSLKVIIVTGNFGDAELNATSAGIMKAIHKIKFDDEHIEANSVKSIILAPKQNATQTVLRLGKVTIPKNHVDFPTLQVANTILGGFFMSRINAYLREEKGLTYGAGSTIDSLKHFSVFTAFSSLNSDGIGDSIDFLNKELNSFAENPITDVELDRSVKFMYGSFVRGTETPGLIANMVQSLLSDDLGLDYYNRFYAKITSLKPEEVTAKAIEHLSAPSYTIAVCSDEKTLQTKFPAAENVIYYEVGKEML